MTGIWIGAILSLAAGLIIAAQGPIYTRMTAILGAPLQTVLVAFTTAAGLVALVILVTGQSWPRGDALRVLPIWVWLGGALGVLVVLLSVLAIPRIGVAGYLAAAICGQLVASLAFDRFGAFGLAERAIGWQGLLGAALIAGGTAMILFRS